MKPVMWQYRHAGLDPYDEEYVWCNCQTEAEANRWAARGPRFEVRKLFTEEQFNLVHLKSHGVINLAIEALEASKNGVEWFLEDGNPPDESDHEALSNIDTVIKALQQEFEHEPAAVFEIPDKDTVAQIWRDACISMKTYVTSPPPDTLYKYTTDLLAEYQGAFKFYEKS